MSFLLWRRRSFSLQTHLLFSLLKRTLIIELIQNLVNINHSFLKSLSLHHAFLENHFLPVLLVIRSHHGDSEWLLFIGDFSLLQNSGKIDNHRKSKHGRDREKSTYALRMATVER